MWFHNLALVGMTPQASPPVTFTFGAAATAILGSIVLLLVFQGIGALMPRYKKFDDVVRVFVAFFGITGVIATVPPFSNLREWLQSHIASGTENAGGAAGWTLAVTIGIAAIGVMIYYTKGKIVNLLWFIVLTLPVFLGTALISISAWYTDVVGQNVFEFVVGFFGG